MLNNPSCFTQSFSFEITFECLQELSQDLEWKVLYVGSSESCEYDQVLAEVQVGPVPQGVHKFLLESDAPDASKLPPANILGVTVVLVTCTYREQEFVRIGYYVNNEEAFSNAAASVQGEYCTMQQQEEEEDPVMMLPTNLSTITRTILADKPRVTRFPIEWDETPSYKDHTPLKTTTTHDTMDTDTTMASADGPPMIVSPTQPMEL